MVLYLLKTLNDVLENLDYARYVLYKVAKVAEGKYYVWIRAGCIGFRGEISESDHQKLMEALEKARKMGKNVVEFEEIVPEDQFFVG